MEEPKRVADIDSLEPYVADRVRDLLAAMRGRGFDPIVYEARRSVQRQKWLYGVGRTHDLHRKPVTWTMKSRHIRGKAADVISKSLGWNWPKFYDTLSVEAEKVGLHTISQERCHVEWQG